MAGSTEVRIKIDGVTQLVRQMDLLLAEVREQNRLLRRSLGHDQQQEEAMAATMEELQAKIDEAIAEVSQNSDVVSSASQVMNALSQQLTDALANAATDPTAAVAAVQTVIDGLNQNNSALSDAVAQNIDASGLPHAEQQ